MKVFSIPELILTSAFVFVKFILWRWNFSIIESDDDKQWNYFVKWERIDECLLTPTSMCFVTTSLSVISAFGKVLIEWRSVGILWDLSLQIYAKYIQRWQIFTKHLSGMQLSSTTFITKRKSQANTILKTP